MLGGMFVIFASVDFINIRGMFEHRVDTVIGLAGLFFDGFWVLAWTVGVLFLFGATLMTLFYRETARISDDVLIHIARLGPLHILLEYELARIRNVRVENAKKLGRIRFDYAGGTISLGNAMDPAVAEQHVKAIAEAIGGLVPVPEPPAIEPVRSARVVSRPAAAGGYLSIIFLVAANFVPVAGVLLFDWNVTDLMVLFWAENVVIGVYALLKMAVISRWGVVVMGPLFLGHYGAFMAIHFMAVYYLFVRGITDVSPESATALAGLFLPLWPALLALFVSHGVSFFYNFLGRREYVDRTMRQQTAEPYQRMALLHVTLIFGAIPVQVMGQPLLALLVLVALKIVMDLRAHLKERVTAARKTTL